MILYQVISTYQLLNAIVHKEKNHPNEKCVLIISNWLTAKHPNYKELNKLFSKVIVMDAVARISDDYLESNTRYCNGLLRENGYKISDFGEIHAMGCHYNFGIFLAYNKIPFCFWEDAAGITSKPEILYNIYQNSFPEASELCKSLGLYDGTAGCVTGRYCNFKAQAQGFDFNKAVDFDVLDGLMSLDKEKMLSIRGFFTDATELEINDDFVLVLTQHFFNLKLLSFEEQALIYQLFIDYFFPNDKIVFKTHPDDLMFYGILFPNSEVIRKKFPSEFLPSLFTKAPRVLTTISSTAIDNLKGYYENSFSLDTRFERDFLSIHKYGVIADIKAKLLGDYQITSVGANEKVVNALMASASGEKRLYIVDDIKADEGINKSDLIDKIENANESDVFAFVNFKNDFCFYDIEHKNIWENLYPVCISKVKSKNEDFYADENEEVFFIYTKNSDFVNKLNSYSYERSLKYTGLDIKAGLVSGEEGCIYLLNALLHATEYALLEADASTSQRDCFDETNVRLIRYSDPSLELENWSESQNKMRILEGIIKATEARLAFSLQEQTKNKKKRKK